MQVYTKTLDEELRYTLWNLYICLVFCLILLSYPSSSPPHTSLNSIFTFPGFVYVVVWNCICCCIFVKVLFLKSCCVIRLVEYIACAVTHCMFVTRNYKPGDMFQHHPWAKIPITNLNKKCVTIYLIYNCTH
jgi:hypothetical protein